MQMPGGLRGMLLAARGRMTSSRYLGLGLALGLGLGLVACSSDPDETEQPKSTSLVLLYTSDEHSQLFAISPELDDYPLATASGNGELVGGVARRATMFTNERAAAQAAGKSVLTVSAGDNTMGTLATVGFRTNAIDYGVMVSLGYDVTTLGNHEFDYGPEALAESLSAAEQGGGVPAMVASNIHFSESDPGDDTLAAHFSEDPSDEKTLHRTRIVTTPEGVRVGFVGFVGVNASDVAPNKAPVAFSELGVAEDQANDPAVVLPKLYAELQPLVDELRPNVDLVVALSHAGMQNPAAPDDGEDTLIAKHVSGIDAIVSGHTHNSEPEALIVDGPDRQVVILNGGSRGTSVGRAEWSIGKSGAEYQPSGHEMPTIDDALVPSTSVVDMDASACHVGESRHAGRQELPGRVALAGGRHGREGRRFSARRSLFPADRQHQLRRDGHPRRAVLERGRPAESAGRHRAGADGAAERGRHPQSAARRQDRRDQRRGRLRRGAPGRQPGGRHRGLPAGGRAAADLLHPRGVRVLCGLGPVQQRLRPGARRGDGGVRLHAADGERGDGPARFVQGRRVQDLGSTRITRTERRTTICSIWDRTDPSVSPTEPISVVTSSYICQFASAVGATPLGADGKPTTCADAIVYDSDNREVKEAQAFMTLLHSFPSGIPELYDSQSASRTKRFDAFPACH